MAPTTMAVASRFSSGSSASAGLSEVRAGFETVNPIRYVTVSYLRIRAGDKMHK